jgi:hypothetical protein
MTVSFGEQNFRFGDSANHDSIDELLELTSPEGTAGNGKIFSTEMVIAITAPGLPNRTFTDIPGLVAEDRLLSDPNSTETLRGISQL